ncbi:MAG: adenosylmethionine decarboxylase [Cocleimonas sp.]|nr:adenosylmethionine decarboxylase [Cocleimonas sp.]
MTQTVWQSYTDKNKQQENDDLFIQCDGNTFAGTHLILDLWGCQQLDNIPFIDTSLRDAVNCSGATLLHLHLHHFTPNGGVSGVAVLAESHISIHTWPERGYAALDIFMCGNTHPEKAVDLLTQAFQPQRSELHTHLRGLTTS